MQELMIRQQDGSPLTLRHELRAIAPFASLASPAGENSAFLVLLVVFILRPRLASAGLLLRLRPALTMRARLVTLLFVFAGVSAAVAHPNLLDAMWVQVEPQRVHVAVNVSLKEICVAQSVALSPFGVVDVDALTAGVDRHQGYVLAHLKISAGTNFLSGKLVSVTPPAELDQAENSFYQYEFEYPLAGLPPAELTLFHDMLKEWPYAAGTVWNVSYVVRLKKSDADAVNVQLLPSGQRVTVATGWPANAAAASPPPANRWLTFPDYLRHGVMHILTGYDHLLFVSALVLATSSIWELFKVIAAFTCAHTLTLALSAFDVFRLPAFIVEPVIALSIVFVAMENMLWPDRAHSRARLAVAFGFGLIHGLGFAGGLLDAMSGLPNAGIWIALAAFSLGVEIGHQIVVLPLFGLLKLGRLNVQAGLHAIWIRCGSGVIAGCGAYYLLVALHERLVSR